MHALTLRPAQRRFLVLDLAFAPELSAAGSPELLQLLELLNSFFFVLLRLFSVCLGGGVRVYLFPLRNAVPGCLDLYQVG